MNILGYSGLDASVRYAELDPDLRRGEERMVQGLDSAAVLLVDGRIVAAAEEERFSFEKHTGAFPRQSILYCLKEAGISPKQIDRVAHGFDYSRYAGIVGKGPRYDLVLDPARQKELWRDRMGLELEGDRFTPFPHHLTHAASAFYPSGFDEALCVVCDGMGEVESLTVYAVRQGEFQVLDRFGIHDSLGILYGLVTVHLGFKFNADEYKVMGLAPYGDPERFRTFFEAIHTIEKNGRYSLHLEKLGGLKQPYYRSVLDHLHQHVLPRPEDSEHLPEIACDFAAAAQACLERLLFHVIVHWRQHTGLRQICLAGGVALNCTFNGKLLQSGLFEQVYVQPAAGDDGSALGAAFLAAGQAGVLLDPLNCNELPYYGPSFTQAEIGRVLNEVDEGSGLAVEDLESEDQAALDAAQALADGEIVAWFQGRLEFGPRALGHRSILANPLLPDIKQELNSVIKLREGFRPFAPAVTRERAHDYFDFVPSAMFDYMLATCPVRPEWRARLPGVTHVDGSARMQTVDRHQNALFHRLITRFGDLTGVHCVVNTSFNLRGQPMIASPIVALETFRKVRIDRLYLGSFRLVKIAAAETLRGRDRATADIRL
jgi:carbamoyltransferase